VIQPQSFIQDVLNCKVFFYNNNKNQCHNCKQHESFNTTHWSQSLRCAQVMNFKGYVVSRQNTNRNNTNCMLSVRHHYNTTPVTPCSVHQCEYEHDYSSNQGCSQEEHIFYVNKVPSLCDFSRCVLSWLRQAWTVSTWVRLCISVIMNMLLQFNVNLKQFPQ